MIPSRQVIFRKGVGSDERELARRAARAEDIRDSSNDFKGPISERMGQDPVEIASRAAGQLGSRFTVHHSTPDTAYETRRDSFIAGANYGQLPIKYPLRDVTAVHQGPIEISGAGLARGVVESKGLSPAETSRNILRNT